MTKKGLSTKKYLEKYNPKFKLTASTFGLRIVSGRPVL
jgi:hypothetical protein